MTRTKLHIAILTAVALATPLFAGAADAKSRGERHYDRGGIEIIIGDRGHRDHRRGYRDHRRGHYGIVSERRIARKVHRLGGERIRSLYLDGDVYRVKAVDYRGNRMRYKFDAHTGNLISARPARRGHRHGRGDYGRRGGVWVQGW